MTPRWSAGAGGLCGALCGVAVLWAALAQAGHEISYYPSFYPQEIRIEPLTPEAAAKEFASKTDPLHAYLGAAPKFAGAAPSGFKSVVSLASFITVSVHPGSAHLQKRDVRCRAISSAASLLAKHDNIVAHAYPVTPFHADYIGHIDRLPDPQLGAPQDAGLPPLQVRADAALAALLGSGVDPNRSGWDLGFDEMPIDNLLRTAGVGANIWLAPPWAKEGWFQAYHLLRTAISDPTQAERADTIYERLTLGVSKDMAERLNLERDLVAALTQGCERAVVGYRLRREFHSDDFANGIENIAVDSQSDLNAPIAIRTVKLKDFPWNGWLRLGIASAQAQETAWNPVAGFADPAGRLVWSAVGDGAYLPITHDGRWVQNRAEILPDEEDRKPNQSLLVPPDALMPEARSGKLASVGAGRGAVAKLTYKLSASAFQDGTAMEPADFLYPYALALRWGEGEANGATFDPDIASATKLLRARLAGVRPVRIEERSLQLADLTFTYRSPIVEVYLNSAASDPEENALIAPPWSSVPWHVLALMEAAAERGLGAFSQTEAARRGIPWLDLVRDKAQLTKLAALIKELAQTAYRPPALEHMVSAEAATARWQALDAFLQGNGHLLVTNGPYRLVSWSPQSTVLAVVRDFTYPVGLGAFDPFAYPAHAIVTSIERTTDRFLIAADIEIAAKQQRDRRLVRTRLTRETLRETYPIRPVARYLVIGAEGRVAAAGNANWESDGRFAAPWPVGLSPGSYTLFTAIFADGNTLDPSVGRLSFESK